MDDVPGLAVYTRVLRAESKTPRLMAERFVDECVVPSSLGMGHVHDKLVCMMEDAFARSTLEDDEDGAKALMMVAVRAVTNTAQIVGLEALCKALAAAGLARMRGLPSPKAWRQLQAFYDYCGLWPTPAVVWNAPAYAAVAEAAGEAGIPAGVRIEDGVDIDERLLAQYGGRFPPEVLWACPRGVVPGAAAVLMAAFRLKR